MPVTTFHDFDKSLPHDNPWIQGLLEDLIRLSGRRWAINVRAVDQCKKYLFFGETEYKYSTELLCEVPGVGNAQLIICVNDAATLAAYLCGAVGHLEKEA